MTMTFNEFKSYFQAHVSNFMKDTSVTDKGIIFISDVSKDELWDTYLNSFPEDVRQGFNCNSCRHFIKSYGGLVKVHKDGLHLNTIWNFEVADPMYQQIVDALSSLVFKSKIRDVFVNNQPKLGTDYNLDTKPNSPVVRWDHLFYKLEREEYQKVGAESDITSQQANYRDTKKVFKRALDEITPFAVDSVVELIEQNNLYRGAEYLHTVKTFQKLQQEYSSILEGSIDRHDNFAWLKCFGGGVGRIRSSAIGSLLVDISSGTDLKTAVTKYESSVVDPTKFKRSKPVATERMVDDAKKTVIELGYKDSLTRRFANSSDVNVNNVLYLNRGSTKVNTSVFDSMKESLPVNPRTIAAKAQTINLQDFLNNVIPNANSIELLLERQQENNLVSLIAPVHPEAPSLLKWDNNISWAYNNGVADSIREKVKSAGGKVDGLLRISLAWDTYSDLDLHLRQPSPGQHIYFSNKKCSRTLGHLDVDENVCATTRKPVENIIYPYNANLIEGKYFVQVHNFTNRETTRNYTVEIEFNGEVSTFDSTRIISPKEYVDVVTFTYTKSRGIAFDNNTKSSQVTSTQIWNIDTNKFHKVNMITYSPNYWAEPGVGNKHLFLILEGCKAPKSNGFFNEFLKEDLYRNHKRVFEVLTNKLEVIDNDQPQLSGVGFSLTSQSQFHVRIDNNRIFKVSV